MTGDRPRFKRVDLTDPTTMAAKLRDGTVWKMGKMFWPDAVKAINDGLVPLAECKDVPSEVRLALA